MSSVPTKITISISSAQEGLEYWLSEVVFRENVQITNISFSEREHFQITLEAKSPRYSELQEETYDPAPHKPPKGENPVA